MPRRPKGRHTILIAIFVIVAGPILTIRACSTVTIGDIDIGCRQK